MESPPSLELGLGPAPRPDLGFIYAGDPMCSWCWGFAPTLEQLERRDGWHTTTPNHPAARWSRCASSPPATRCGGSRACTGPSTSTASTASTPPTRPSCRPCSTASTSIRDASPRSWLTRPRRSAPARTSGRRSATGPTGFPTLLLRDGEELGIATRGYVPWEQLEPALTRWLEDRYGDRTDGLACVAGHGSVLSPPVRHHEPAAGLTAPGRAPARAAGATPRRWSGRRGRRATAGRW